MRRIALALLLAALAGSAEAACRMAAPDARAAGPGCARAWMDANLKLNDVAAIGTHNSYKLAIPPDELAMLAAAAPKAAPGLDYAHTTLTAELDMGARNLEIDVVHDPQGGRFADPILPRRAGRPFDAATRAVLARPGFKVLHVPDVDVRTNCLTLIACLTEVRRWSDAHPDHAPILVTMNSKQGRASSLGGVAPLPFDAAAFDALDAEIKGVLGAKLITPDEVRGGRATLREAVLAGGWPTLGRARGRILMSLDEPPAVVAVYKAGRAALQGRALFVNTDETNPASAFVTLNEPIELAARIRAAVSAGFIVRTRADADTVEARSGETRRRDTALASGAQFVSTDYLKPDTRFSAYFVPLPEGVAARCNPVRAAAKCAGLAIEAGPATR